MLRILLLIPFVGSEFLVASQVPREVGAVELEGEIDLQTQCPNTAFLQTQLKIEANEKAFEASDDVERLIDHRVHRSLGSKGFHGLQLQPMPQDAKVLRPEKIFFFTHHKSGTILARAIGNIMARILGTKMDNYGWAPVDGWSCSASYVAIYQNIEEKTLKRLQTQCPGFRAVHLVREAAAVTVSAYMYHKNPKDGDDSIPNAGDDMKTLLHMSTEKGLLLEAAVQSRYTMQDMLNVSNQVNGWSNVQRVGLEEFSEDYDGVTRRMFSFLLGPDHPKINQIVKAAASQDVARWPQKRLANNAHIADEAMAEHLLEILLGMVGNSSEVRTLLSYDEPLGYKVPQLALESDLP
eukprot:TRINITY_DN78523_c0_g1_i1.p1 TRINITY_DN78523_c0_g1~~TRINITY_DN78523_c0_g1_i1.p1  ORF type:complete len:351 (-),score=74.94 TRINITY_DN78523_c0_g1_i1:103-1155(-)